MSALSVALVGAGVIGRNHASVIARIPSLRLAAVIDPVPDLLEAPAYFASLSEGLAAVSPDLVVICTPSGMHVGPALEALAAGAHVVIEKPLDVTVSAARPLLSAARRAPRQVVSVISQHRFDPATVAVKAALEAGSFGRVTSAAATVPWWRGQDYYDSARWRGTLALDGGGALMNQGVHTLDLLLHFLGRPVSVFAYADRLAHSGIEVEDVLVAVLRFASGAVATLHATTAAFPGSGVRIQVHGSSGSAVLCDDQLESVAYGRSFDSSLSAGPPGSSSSSDASLVTSLPGAEPFGSPKPSDNFVIGHLRQYDDIVQAIVSHRPPAVTLDDGFLALLVVEAIYESAATGLPVSIDGITA